MDTIRKKALQHLAKRELSRERLRAKLIEAGFEKEAIELVLAELAASGLQSDLRFAQNWVRYREQSGLGPNRILAELEYQGVSQDVIQSVLDPHDQKWILQMTRMIERRFPKTSGQFLPKKARFLENRGYTVEDISRVLNREKTYDDD
jgi:regulatory protein